MRTTIAIAAAFLLALVLTPAGQAHFLPHHKHMTLERKIAYFERSIKHDQFELHVVNRALAAHDPQESARLRYEWHWHKHALRWHRDLLRRYSARRRVYVNDFLAATRIVGRYYGSGVEGWLQNCSSSEGGHGGWEWIENLPYPKYGDLTTPGGWMQFMRGTFYSNMAWAFVDAESRGLRLDRRARDYFSPLGQAVVAGAMYAHHGNPGTWTGVKC